LYGLAFFLAAASLGARADINEGIAAHAIGQYDKAVEQFLPLAETARHPIAQYYLGSMYAQGQGLTRSLADAAKWYRAAAEQGLPQAQVRLAKLYVAGQGLPKDLEAAYAWFSVAEHMGHAQARNEKTAVEGQLAPDNLAHAKQLAADYTQKYGQRPDQRQTTTPPRPPLVPNTH
jgi:hypothetical protein